MTDEPPVSFLARLWLWLYLFRVLFDVRLAARIRTMSATPPTRELTAGPLERQQAGSRREEGTAAMGPALQLLSLLQREGRLVDFLEQDITTFSDADIGAAARVVHEGCRNALHAHARIEPVLVDDEGARVELAAGFDAGEVKLIGDVRGVPPYRGVLRHRGWRAANLMLPTVVGGHDAHVLAPAEVEIG